MRFHTPPPKEKIFAFQKVLKVIVACFLFLLGCWHLYQSYVIATGTSKHATSEALTSLFFSILTFGLSAFLYANRTNNAGRYDAIGYNDP